MFLRLQFFFLGRVGDVFCVFSSCRLPRSVSGLVWALGPLIYGTGHVSGVLVLVYVVLGMFVLFSFSSCRPPPARELGMIWIKLTTNTGELDRLAFCANLSLFRRYFLAPPPLQVVRRWLSLTIYFCPLRIGLPFSFFFCVPCRLHNLAVQRFGSRV